MAPFSSSTAVLTSFGQSADINLLCADYGERLQGLTQSEKYQLVVALGLTLWNAAEKIESESDDDDDDDDDTDHLDTVLSVQTPDFDDKPWTAFKVLKNEDLNNLACILSAIAEYAKEDDRLHPKD
jgi:hypothetical protein